MHVVLMAVEPMAVAMRGVVGGGWFGMDSQPGVKSLSGGYVNDYRPQSSLDRECLVRLPAPPLTK